MTKADMTLLRIFESLLLNVDDIKEFNCGSKHLRGNLLHSLNTFSINVT